MRVRILAFMIAVALSQFLATGENKGIQGRWMADYYGKNESLQLNLTRGGSNNGFRVPLRELTGLSEQQIISSSSRREL
jgi:hypothetical protein